MNLKGRLHDRKNGTDWSTGVPCQGTQEYHNNVITDV